jgi:TetR/AcrR family transcriptional regulator
MTDDSTPVQPKQVRNAKVTRERILKVAAKEFATRGYDGARIEAIVQRCNVSKNLIYHYFENKEALFIEVMERAYGAMRERQNELSLKGDDPVHDMRELVVKTTKHLMGAPDLLQLLATENMHKAAHIRKSTKITTMFSPLRAVLAQALEKGKLLGVFRHDADWVDLYVSISGLASYYVTNRYTLSYVLNIDLGDPVRVQRHAAHVADMVMSYLCNVKGAEQAPMDVANVLSTNSSNAVPPEPLASTAAARSPESL